MKWYSSNLNKTAQNILYGPQDTENQIIDHKNNNPVPDTNNTLNPLSSDPRPIPESNFNVEIGIEEESKKRAFKVLIFGVPGTPIHELGEKLSEYYNVDLYDLNRDYEDGYFLDKIPSIHFDTGDRGIGSASQHTLRDPKTEERYRAIDKFLNIPNLQTESLSYEDKMNIYSIKNGIIVSEIGEPVLLHWIMNGEGVVFFLDIDEENAVKWLKDRRKCYVCGAAYHLIEKKPRQYEICDRCGTDLVMRAEDEPRNVRHQYNIWRNDFSDLRKKLESCDFIKIDVDSKKDFNFIVDECRIRLNNRFKN